MKPWVEEKEVVYPLYLPQVSTKPTTPERQELAYRWFHRQNVEEIKRNDFENFKALNLVFYDYDLEIRELSFGIAYLGLADDGKVYHATAGDEWVAPYHISSYALRGEQLYLRLSRSNRWVEAWLGAAALYGALPGLIASGFARRISGQPKKETKVSVV